MTFLVAVLLGSLGKARPQADIVLPGDTAPEPAAGTQENPAISHGPRGVWLAVWEDTRISQAGFQEKVFGGFEDKKDLFAIRLDDAGQPLDPVPFILPRQFGHQRDPDVAWNGQHWLVVWETRYGGSFTGGIYGTRVAPDGTVLDDPPIMIEDTADYAERDPSVASDGSRWAVFYTDNHGNLDTLDAARVTPSGTVDLKQMVLAGPNPPVNPRAAFSAGKYLIGYSRGSQGVYTKQVDLDLNDFGSQNLIESQAPIHDLAGNGSSFFVVWSGVRGTPLNPNGTAVVPGGVNCHGTANPMGGFDSAVAWDGTNWQVVFPGSLTGGPLGPIVTRVDSSGTLIGNPIQPAGTSHSMREVAIDGTSGSTLISWNDFEVSDVAFSWIPLDQGDVWGASVGADGVAGSRTAWSIGAPLQSRPAIAGDAAHGYLVAFLSEVSGQTRISCQRLNSAGFPIDPAPIVIATHEKDVVEIDVAWNGSVWLVVWEDYYPNPGNETQGQIRGARVAPDGSILDTPPLQILPGLRPGVDAAGDTFLVSAQWAYAQAARVRGSDGVVLDPSPIQFEIPSVSRTDVLGFDDRWLVVWGKARGAWVDLSGNIIIGPTLIADTISSLNRFSLKGLARSGDLGVILFTFGEFGTTTYPNERDIRARRFQADGTFLDPSYGNPVCTAGNDQLDPTITFDGTDFQCAWTDFSPSHPAPQFGDIRMTALALDGSVQNPCGDPVFVDPVASEGRPDLASDGGITLMAASVFESDAPYANVRIRVRSFGNPGSITAYCPGDGFIGNCPCGNADPSGTAGCANSSGVGAVLSTNGSASAGLDDLSFLGAQLLPNQPALLFAGVNSVNNGQGVPFGDGLRCAGGSVVRLGVASPDSNGAAQWGPGLQPSGGWSQGDVRRFQIWYRDPSGSPCGNGFNLSNGIEVTFGP